MQHHLEYGVFAAVADAYLSGNPWWYAEAPAAPGGQVFRLVGTTEDMSKWQR